MGYVKDILQDQKQLLEIKLGSSTGVEFIETREKYREVNDVLNKLNTPTVVDWQPLDDINSLKRGDIVRHKGSLEPCVINANYGNRATATIVKDITNPCEWEILAYL